MTAAIMIGIFVLGWLVRLARARSRHVAQPTILNSHLSAPAHRSGTYAHTPSARPRSAKRQLLLRAAQGLLLALLLILCSLLPWPTAGVISSALAPDVRLAQAYLWDHRDALVFGIVALAMVEPLLIGIVHTVLMIPRAVWLSGQLLCVGVRLAYWRFRQRYTTWTWALSQHVWRCRRRRFLAACSQPALCPVPLSGIEHIEQQINELLEGAS